MTEFPEQSRRQALSKLREHPLLLVDKMSFQFPTQQGKNRAHAMDVLTIADTDDGPEKTRQRPEGTVAFGDGGVQFGIQPKSWRTIRDR